MLKWLVKETPQKDWDKDLDLEKLILAEVTYNKKNQETQEMHFQVLVHSKIELQIKWSAWDLLIWDKTQHLAEMKCHKKLQTKDSNLIYLVKAHISSCNFTQQDYKDQFLKRIHHWEIDQLDLVELLHISLKLLKRSLMKDNKLTQYLHIKGLILVKLEVILCLREIQIIDQTLL